MTNKEFVDAISTHAGNLDKAKATLSGDAPVSHDVLHEVIQAVEFLFLHLFGHHSKPAAPVAKPSADAETTKA